MTTEGNQPLALYFRAEGLKDMDVTSKSDPYVCLLDATGRPIGRTETIKDNLNPKWIKSLDVMYVFETKQQFSIKVFDDDGRGMGDDALGTASFQLAHVMSSRDATLKLPLGSGTGFVYITGSPKMTTGLRDTVQWAWMGKKLKNMDFMGKSDPYYKLHRINPNGTLTQLYLSKVVDDCLDPIWERQPVMRVSDLSATGNPNAKSMRFECFDKDVTSDDEMGFFDFSLNELLQNAASGAPFFLRDAKGAPFGDIHIQTGSLSMTRVPSFLDYIRCGLQINLAIAIDFTGSNGDPRQPTSLHYMDPARPNQYVRAIMSVADILMEYDTDKMVPAFGFGARMPDGNVSHCFHLNFQPNPYVAGVQGVLDCYGRTLASVRLSGPTNFQNVIDTATQLARASPMVYTVLLILTDGDITDMNETINSIVGADDAPLSMVIVGVGNGCDFQMMDRLDADREPLRNAQGRQSRRDIVQFVPFRNFDSQPPAALAAEVLREIPDQIVDWATKLAARGAVPEVTPPGTAPQAAAAAPAAAAAVRPQQL